MVRTPRPPREDARAPSACATEPRTALEWCSAHLARAQLHAQGGSGAMVRTRCAGSSRTSRVPCLWRQLDVPDNGSRPATPLPPYLGERALARSPLAGRSTSTAGCRAKLYLGGRPRCSPGHRSTRADSQPSRARRSRRSSRPPFPSWCRRAGRGPCDRLGRPISGPLHRR